MIGAAPNRQAPNFGIYGQFGSPVGPSRAGLCVVAFGDVITVAIGSTSALSSLAMGNRDCDEASAGPIAEFA